jgi:hypothetical protein
MAPLALILAAGAGLSSCSWFHGTYDDGKCPVVAIPDDLARVSHFQGQGTDFANLTVAARLSDIKGGCTFDKDGVSLDMTVSLVAQSGPAMTDRNADFAYFVAILDPAGKIVAKRVFPAPIAFPEGQTRRGSIETIDERIPLKDYHEAGNYRVEIGFQLSEEELSFNRGGH